MAHRGNRGYSREPVAPTSRTNVPQGVTCPPDAAWAARLGLPGIPLAVGQVTGGTEDGCSAVTRSASRAPEMPSVTSLVGDCSSSMGPAAPPAMVTIRTAVARCHHVASPQARECVQHYVLPKGPQQEGSQAQSLEERHERRPLHTAGSGYRLLTRGSYKTAGQLVTSVCPPHGP